MLACALISSCVAVTFGSCGGGEAKDTYVPDENTYRWANTPAVQAEMDEGVKIDGDLTTAYTKISIGWTLSTAGQRENFDNPRGHRNYG